MSKLLFSTLASYVAAQPTGFTYAIGVNDAGDSLKFTVDCPENTWFAIVYKYSMMNSDMVRFKCSGDGSVEDLYSTGYRWPNMDSTQDYFDTTVTKSGSKYSFTTYRKLTNNDSQDMDVACGTTYTMGWAAHTSTSGTSKHNNKGSFSLTIPADKCASSSSESESSSSSESTTENSSGTTEESSSSTTNESSSSTESSSNDSSSSSSSNSESTTNESSSSSTESSSGSTSTESSSSDSSTTSESSTGGSSSDSSTSTSNDNTNTETSNSESTTTSTTSSEGSSTENSNTATTDSNTEVTMSPQSNNQMPQTESTNDKKEPESEQFLPVTTDESDEKNFVSDSKSEESYSKLIVVGGVCVVSGAVFMFFIF